MMNLEYAKKIGQQVACENCSFFLKLCLGRVSLSSSLTAYPIGQPNSEVLAEINRTWFFVSGTCIVNWPWPRKFQSKPQKTMKQMDSMDYSYTSTEVDNWLVIRSCVPLLSILSFYLLLIYKILPKFMQNRSAYSLKTFITLYNIAQIVACVYIVQEVYHIISHKVFQFWKCDIFPRNSYEEHAFNRLSYFALQLKVVELSETVVFVLRKKQKQVSFLHVFHHCSTITLIYCILRQYRHGQTLYPLFLNSIVHIIMYSYYLAAAVCSKETVKSLLPVKKSITTIQMIQFVLILTQAATLACICNIPKLLSAYYCTVVGVIFYGFYDFYKKNYTTPQGPKKGASC